MPGSNLTGWLFGSGTKNRELRETRRAWDDTEVLWRGSPLGESNFTPLLLEIHREAERRADRLPASPITTAAFQAMWDLLAAEPIRGINAIWPVIETDPEAAIEFRAMMALRQRWSADYSTMFGEFRRIAAETLAKFYDLLPDTCFHDWDAERPDVFEVPLLDLVDDPHEAIACLLSLPYDNAAFRLDLFKSLREQGGLNILTASGFSAETIPALVKSRLKYPRDLKTKTGAEVADLYLRGSPLRALVDVPIPFHIPEAARFEHCHIVGGTGHGKTQLLQKMIHSDLVKAQDDGRSVIVIDSQGDLINKLVRLDLFSSDTPNSLADRLVLIDPSDVEYPAALNLFDAHVERVRDYSAADRERVLNGVVELYELFFGAFLGAELTQKQGVIFRYLARLMLAVPDATIYTLIKIMEDGKPYKQYMDQLDGAARHFFETEFFHPSFAATKKQVIRRLWGVLSTPAFERMFTQPKNKLDLFEAMNEGKIVLVSTAKDLLKRDGSQLLGRFFIAMIMQAALERSTLKDYQRTATFVYVDEAQEYFDESVETILNQARKYRVGLTIAHQTLDQGSPALRSALLANTSIKCAGGVSAKDARNLASELHTSSDFIESMKRRGDRTEFALWVKQQTGQAIRLTVPLGFLERQPTLDSEEYDALLDRNRISYCGTLADVASISLPPVADAGPQPLIARPQEAPLAVPPPPAAPEPTPEPVPDMPVPRGPQEAQREVKPAPASAENQQPGKGGKNHRYLQALAKQLAEQQGLRATLEASLPGGAGQTDVLLERGGPIAAIEISVSTPVEYEKLNLRKCLAAGFPRVGVVLAKSKRTRDSYRAALTDILTEEERGRVSFLAPEDLPDFIASVAPPAVTSEKVVRGYRVKVSHTPGTLDEIKARQEAVARVIARSLE